MAPARLANRLKGSSSNIWVEFNALASEFSKLNLGQGQPNYAPSRYIQETLAEVVLEGNDYLQYTREQGHPRLVEAIAALHGPLLGRTIDPLNEVIITHGAYESLSSCFQGLINPGDEVIIIEPFYDCYDPMIKMVGGVPVPIPLRPVVEPPTSSSHWTLNPEELARKFSEKTKAIVLNTPNNPLGKVYSKSELQMIAELCIKHDVICISDEVYEWLVYPGSEHVRIATLAGMWDRTVTISSSSKSFSVSGWRVGWSIGPKDIIDCLMIAHQNGDCVCTTPAQEAIARCIETEIPRLSKPDCHFTTQMSELLKKRDSLVKVLGDTGFTPLVPDAGYFVIADWSALATNEMIEDGSHDTTDFKFAKWLMKKHKIAGIPPSAFYSENKQLPSRQIRFCFFKTDEMIEQCRAAFETLRQ